MKKIRWALLLLALGIALPAGLIVQRAIASLALESAVRHEAVAERILDEMERSLSDFLLREESRPPTDYALLDAPSDAPSDASNDSTETSTENARLRRALFENADEPFIVGWFSLDARGNARTLVVHADGVSRIASAIRDVLGPRAPTASRKASADQNGPAAGRTQSLGTRSLSKDRAGKAQLATPLDEQELVESNAYDVLQSLNRAQRLRSERQEKTLRKSSSRPSPKKTASDMLLAQPSAAPSLERMSAPAEEAKLADEDDVDERTGPIVDPLIGRPTGTGDIVLTRSIWRGPDVERQGMVLDRPALVAWLEMQVLAESGLSNRVDIQFGERELLDATPDVSHRYRHRFAEPFDALVAQLDLEALPGLAGERPIYALALLLTVVAVIGLFAVDRMTRVVIDYARRRSEFVAAVSHELKTPLTSIRMYGEMLRDGLVSSDEKRSEYYTTITAESERLSRLIDNVLDFSRLEQNQRALSLVVGSLSEAIRDAADKLRAHVEREGFHLKLDLDDSLPTVQFDRDGVTQLVFNLVDNALKYARHAETRDIEVGLHLENGRIELRVRDHGPGIPDDQLRRVFEPFYRVGEELTRTTEGAGIGLALVKELAENMGAVVRGRNATGGGFEVRIAFAAAS